MDRCAVVSGAAHGIGAATVAALVSQGWRVVALDLDERAVRRLVDEGGGAVEAVVGDVADPTAFDDCRELAESFGRLAGWVNNAGILDRAPLHDADLADLDRVLAVNLRGTLLGTRTALRSFLDSGSAGAIVNVSSVHGRHPFPGHPGYAATKGAIESLTRQVCVDYGAMGIRCNAVAPGAVATAMTYGSDDDPDRRAALVREAAMLSPMRRVSSPGEIAALVSFLMSDQAGSINGHVLDADNGLGARGHGVTPPSPPIGSGRRPEG